MNRTIAAALAAAFVLLLATAVPSGAESGAEPEAVVRPAASTDVLPDLGMAHLKNFKIEYASGKRLLRFDSIVVNTGRGRFEVRGSRPDRSTATMTVRQHLYNTTGGRRAVKTDAVMYFGGDGHNHWHVRDLETFNLKPSGESRTVRVGAKHGFCFYDNYRFGSNAGPYYTHCGDSDDLVVTMGLSRGWGDIYTNTLPDQYVDITGIPDGRYRMVGIADRENWFRESDNTNNKTWVNLRIDGGTVRVLKQGVGAQPI